MNKTQEFMIRAEWISSKIITVKASSLEDALLNTKADLTIDDPHYIKGSLYIDEEETRILNEEF